MEQWVELSRAAKKNAHTPVKVVWGIIFLSISVIFFAILLKGM